ncbi:hypothetical protein CO037_01195 [Candidatus Pacearchaeota archaeon CG_4_9_14_0_2_um_filter_30_8]|nr:MAG: hypothetical protein CO037_01195 [Candidatus Pacearchaeota archaeon CG_4_9_14_0_2_um_filter_30_8]
MEKIISELINEAKKDKEILAVALFGSYGKKEKPEDIDLALILNVKKPKKEMSKIRLKYLSKFNSRLDINIFDQLPIYIKIQILKENRFLIIKDENKIYEVAFNTIKEFGSYKKIYDYYLQNVKNG